MLRIRRRRKRDSTIVLHVEGWITSDTLSILEEECRSLANAKVYIDLVELGYADGKGLELLRRLQAQGLSLVNVPPLIAELLRE